MSDLRVTTAHVRELAAKQGQAAAEIVSATEVVTGVDTDVRWTHGIIAWSTAAAVEAATCARRDAGAKMGSVAHGLGAKLTSAAARYDGVDSTSSGRLDGEMPA
jgi:hypothetical protein